MSAAVGDERKSATLGYAMTAGNFQDSSPNLPVRIPVLAEANTDNQLTLSVDEWVATSLKAVGDRFGYGSPCYLIARILMPVVGGIPVVFYPQAEAPGATAKTIEIVPTGTATEDATHYVKIAGRDGLDGSFYAFTVQQGDTNAELVPKINNAINSVLGCPMTAEEDPYAVTCTSKWKGKTANELNIEIDTGDVDAGITYTINNIQNGAGVPSLSTTLANESFVNKWNTHLVNSYGTETSIMSALESWNGVPDPITPTGRYKGTVMKPLRAYTGSIAEDPSSITDPRKTQVTIVIAPAPLSPGLSLEAAANLCALSAVVAQNSPHLDVMNMPYPDMPCPNSIGAMSDYDERDRIIKLGCSTVEAIDKRYYIIDSVTTYHPEGEQDPVFLYDRDLTVAMNIRYGVLIREKQFVWGHALVNDGESTTAKKVVKPSTWKQKLSTYFDDLVARALITDKKFTMTSLRVKISSTNSQRFETDFRTKLTSIARINATIVEMGHNFGK